MTEKELQDHCYSLESNVGRLLRENNKIMQEMYRWQSRAFKLAVAMIAFAIVDVILFAINLSSR